MLDTWSGTPDAFPADIRAEYVAKLADPTTVHAICEEYRAAVTLDVEHDEADRGKRRITCPTLVLWGETAGGLGHGHQPLDLWKAWADDVRGGPLPAGYFLPEEAPDETAHHLLELLTDAGSPHDPDGSRRKV